MKMPKRRMQMSMDESNSGCHGNMIHTMPLPDLPHKFPLRRPHARNSFTRLAARRYTLEQQLCHKVKKGLVSLLSRGQSAEVSRSAAWRALLMLVGLMQSGATEPTLSLQMWGKAYQ